MNLILNEIKLTIKECEDNKKVLLREADRIKEERKCYEHIKHLMGVIDYDTVRQNIKTS